MNCPVCTNVNLVIADRQGVEIDYCPQCRGVWLDRGELDKIIDRAGAALTPASDRPSRPSDQEYRREYDEHDRYRGKKRKSFLGELFDFD